MTTNTIMEIKQKCVLIWTDAYS